MAQNFAKYLGYFCKELCSQELLKNRPIWSHCSRIAIYDHRDWAQIGQSSTSFSSMRFLCTEEVVSDEILFFVNNSRLIG